MTKKVTWYRLGDLAAGERDSYLVEANIALAACDLDVFTENWETGDVVLSGDPRRP
jgi:hypothetical protein